MTDILWHDRETSLSNKTTQLVRENTRHEERTASCLASMRSALTVLSALRHIRLTTLTQKLFILNNSSSDTKDNNRSSWETKTTPPSNWFNAIAINCKYVWEVWKLVLLVGVSWWGHKCWLSMTSFCASSRYSSLFCMTNCVSASEKNGALG